MTAERDWKQRYTTLLRQTEFVIRAAEEVVPQRVSGMHPNLLHLHDQAQAWRNFVSAEREDFEAGDVADAWVVMRRAELSPSSDLLALLATFESMRLLMVSPREDFQQRGREGIVALLGVLEATLRSTDEGADELASLVAQWGPEAKRLGIEW